jgi:hypothetical protein
VQYEAVNPDGDHAGVCSDGLAQETLLGSETQSTKVILAHGADQFLAEDQDEVDAEASPFGIMNEVHMDSRVNCFVRVCVNGQYRATVSPYADIFPFVGDSPNGVPHLYAVSTDGRL